MNEVRFTELPPEKQTERQEWMRRARAHYGDEHKRWGDSLFNTLTLANTGGIVVVASLISTVEVFRSSVCLRLALTFFVLGLVFTLNAIRHEFNGTSKRIRYWDANNHRYLAGEITFGEFYGPLQKHAQITLADRIIGWAPGILFAAGAITGFVFLWS